MAKHYEAMRKYEAVFVFDADLGENALQDEIKKVETIIASHEGTVSNTDNWGRRQLAYLINKKKWGVYVLYTFEGNTKLVTDLERQSKINESVLRFLVVVKDKYAPDLSEQARSFLTGGPAAVAPGAQKEESSAVRSEEGADTTKEAENKSEQTDVVPEAAAAATDEKVPAPESTV